MSFFGEPTNGLDIQSIAQLEKDFHDWFENTVIVVSRWPPLLNKSAPIWRISTLEKLNFTSETMISGKSSELATNYKQIETQKAWRKRIKQYKFVARFLNNAQKIKTSNFA